MLVKCKMTPGDVISTKKRNTSIKKRTPSGPNRIYVEKNLHHHQTIKLVHKGGMPVPFLNVGLKNVNIGRIQPPSCRVTFSLPFPSLPLHSLPLHSLPFPSLPFPSYTPHTRAMGPFSVVCMVRLKQWVGHIASITWMCGSNKISYVLSWYLLNGFVLDGGGGA